MSCLSAEAIGPALVNFNDVIHTRIFPIMVETFLYDAQAIFVVSIAVSSSILIRRGLHNPANKAMFIITIMMFVLSTICWACGIRLLWNDLAAITLSDSPDAPNHPCLVNTGSVNGPLKFLAYISNDICTVMSDGVVAWRAWIVCRKDRRFAILAAILFTGLLVAGILGELASLTIYFPGLIDILPLVDRYLKFSATWFFISTTINVMSTGLIAYRAWCHRKYVCKFLNDESKKRFEVGRVLMLVVDTGIVYTLFWIFIAVSKIMEYANAGSHVFITGPLRFFSEALQYQVTGLYPTVIIILVSLQKSQLENQFTYTGANAAPEIASLSKSAPRMPQAFTASQVMTGSSEHAAFHHSSDCEALSSDIGEAAGDRYEELKNTEEIV